MTFIKAFVLQNVSRFKYRLLEILFILIFLNAVEKCERPDDPINGNVVSRKKNQEVFGVDEKVWFKCDKGFDLVGKKNFVCRKNGNWKPQPFPKCARKSKFYYNRQITFRTSYYFRSRF